MSPRNEQKRQVVQAQRFSDDAANTYNAYTAIQRANRLMHDADQLERMLEVERESDDPPLRDWYGLEIVSYYAVGLVTCLEWHARSRLTDLYTYRPHAIEKKALDGKINTEILAQMVGANVSIAQLLGASMAIGATDEYIGVFNRVFDVLEIKTPPDRIIQPTVGETRSLFGDVVREPTVRERLDRLFEARHSLVHEIGITRSASPAISENWSVSEVLLDCPR